ncbi:MAG: hypothetical protein RBT63_09275 [Bdellovibrionales bacterium]|jgi:hypothetical protein|nr:hypothetical protein [Bdellovibrionales bacterium]
MTFNSIFKVARTQFVLTSVVFLLVVVGSVEAVAQQAKVVKVQGRRAIVQFPDEARPTVGQTLELGGKAVSSSGGSGSREQIIGGAASLDSISSGGGSSTSSLSVEGRYGWNKEIMEYGGLAVLHYSSSAGSSARHMGIGGFFDFNLVPNVAGTEFVYGAGAVASYGSTSTAVGAAETTGSIMAFEGGAQVKWFPLGNSVAIRGDAIYKYESISRGAVSGSSSGLGAKIGFYVYF